MVGLANPTPKPGAGLDPLPGVDARAESRTLASEAQAPRRVLSSSWSAARESVRQALTDLDLTLATARATLRTLGRIEEAASAGDPTGAIALLAQLHEDVDRAIKAGARALTGAPVRVATEGEAAPVEILGMDLRLKGEAQPDDPMRLSRACLTADPSALAGLARESIARVYCGYDRLQLAARRLQAHDGFLALAEGGAPSGVMSDLNADAARLLALTVRQGLSEASGSIANARPDSLLSLFRG
jgi:hypothetical protein